MVHIEEEKCISCLACISACPYGIIEMSGLFISIIDDKKCKKCEKKQCKVLCPTGAIILG
jgi:Fe-S-cluster-containing hydrogenase component 2